jgi:hypothetical protein
MTRLHLIGSFHFHIICDLSPVTMRADLFLIQKFSAHLFIIAQKKGQRFLLF